MEITRDRRLMDNLRKFSYCKPAAFLVMTSGAQLQSTDKIILWQRDPDAIEALPYDWEVLTDQPFPSEDLEATLRRLMQDVFGDSYLEPQWEELGVETHKGAYGTLVCTFILLGRLPRLPELHIVRYLSKFQAYKVLPIREALALRELREEHAAFLRHVAVWCGDEELQMLVHGPGRAGLP